MRHRTMHTEIITPTERRIRDAQNLMRIFAKLEEIEAKFQQIHDETSVLESPVFRDIANDCIGILARVQKTRRFVETKWQKLMDIQVITLP